MHKLTNDEFFVEWIFTFILPLKMIGMPFSLSIQIVNEDINQGMTKDGAHSTPSKITLLIDFYSLKSLFRIWSMNNNLFAYMSPNCPIVWHQILSNALLDIHLVTLILSCFFDQSSEHSNNSNNHNILVALDPS